MRTLKLNHDQIEILLKSLEIAEKKFTDIYGQIVSETCISIGKDGLALEDSNSLNHAKFYHQKSCEFSDLRQIIKDGELDI